MTQSRPLRWLAALGGATMLSVLAVLLQRWFAHLISGEPPRLVRTLPVQLLSWYVWAALSPAIFALLRRARIEGRRPLPGLGVQLAAGGVFAAIHLVCTTPLAVLVHAWGPGPTGWRPAFESMVVNRLPINLLEYGMLVAVYHAVAYYAEARDRALAESRLEAKVAQAQLHALRMQLHPHFLFNTLNAIVANVRQDPGAAEQMLVRLSELLRISLQTASEQESPLDRELDFLRRYLELQQFRFPDRLRVHFDVSGDVRDALVPSLILQPLVENAIRHGLGPRAASGQLSISARRDDGVLRLVVADDGVGLRGEVVDGIGLSNTRARLAQLYGERHTFLIRGAEGGGVTVTVELPYHVVPMTERV